MSILCQRPRRTRSIRTGTSSHLCTSCNAGTRSEVSMSLRERVGGTLACSLKTSRKRTFSRGEHLSLLWMVQSLVMLTVPVA